VNHDLYEMWGKHMAADLRTYIGQMRAAMDRGLRLTAQDVLDGLEIALDERRRNDLPIAYDIGLDRIEDRVRSRVRESNRRFGQPHYGHSDAP